MITFDGIIFSAGNRLGGISVYFRELLREAARSGLEMQVLVHDPKITPEQLATTSQQIVFRRPRLLERFRTLRGLNGGLLHSSYYRTAREPGVRNVVTVYDFTYERFCAGARAIFHSMQKRAAVMRADAVICISENTRRDLREFIPKYPVDRVFVTHLAASEQFVPLDSAAFDLMKRPFALFVGARADYKNFATAVRAVGLTREIALVCVGGGPFSSEERELLEGIVPGRYVHAGAVAAAKLNELYNAALCLVYPSLYEGFGIPPLEAMRAGCPFIALRRTSIPEVAGDAGVLLEESEPESFAAAITACCDAGWRSQLRERGFEQAAKFSWNRTFRETLRVYELLEPS